MEFGQQSIVVQSAFSDEKVCQVLTTRQTSTRYNTERFWNGGFSSSRRLYQIVSATTHRSFVSIDPQTQNTTPVAQEFEFFH